MTMTFNEIPIDLRAPLFYAEIDNSRAGYYTQNLRSIIFGYVLFANQGEAGHLQPISTPDEARAKFGWGSMLARQVAAFRANRPTGDLWVYPLQQPTSGAAASWALTFSGPATEAGHVYLYVAGQRVQVPIPAGTSAVSAATLVARYINRQKNLVDVFRDLPVNASNKVDESGTETVTFTAKNKGIHGNAIDIQLNYYRDSGERLPPGLTATIAQVVTGTGTVGLDSALAAIGDEPFDHWITPFNAPGDLATISDFLEARYGPMKELYGQIWTGKRDTYSNIRSFGEALNERTLSISSLDGSPTWDVEIGAAYGGVASRAFAADPSLTLQDLELVGVLPPPFDKRWNTDQVNNLLYAGISPLVYEGGAVRIARSITTYQVNAYGAEDTSFLETTRLATLAAVIRRVKNLITRRYGRVKVVPNNAKLDGGVPHVSPRMMRATLISQYEGFCRRGWCRNQEQFESLLEVEIDGEDPSRMNILYPPILTSSLSVVATKVQFRL
ncbi:phage tail sheath subtilisin-like domain-containing protein [Methylolobus aquaticus]